MDIDELPFEKIKTLLKEDHQTVSLQLRTAALFLVVYENIKEIIEDRTADFFTEEWGIEGGKLVGIKRSQKYGDMLKGKGKFRASREFFVEIGAMDKSDDELISRFIAYRGEVAHQLYEILLDDQKSHLDIDLLMNVFSLAAKIEKWWILNVEIPTDPDFDGVEVGEADIQPGRQIFLSQLFRVAFKDILEVEK